MNINNWLKAAVLRLSQAHIITARLDCLVLLSDELKKDKAWLLAHPEYELQGSILKKLNNKVAQRVKHIPLAYLRGKVEFYGREFVVNEHTLVPRSETETMIDLLKELCKVRPSASFALGRTLHIADIGTGSGAIAITAKLELPGAHVIATDVDENCLASAKTNAQKLGADIAFLHGNLLEPLATHALANSPTILLCNLPYVPDAFPINRAATHEPPLALFGGPDGLDLYRQLFKQVIDLPGRPQYILAESLPSQHEKLTRIANTGGYSLGSTTGFIQLFRLQE